MPRERFAPDDPREWLNFAADDLAIARADIQEVRDLAPYCFHAQQAAEKAIKAVLLRLGVEFPYTHDLKHLLGLVRGAGAGTPEGIRNAERLTRYAALTRYPFSLERRVTPEERADAVAAAAAVLAWAEGAVGYSPGA